MKNHLAPATSLFATGVLVSSLLLGASLAQADDRAAKTYDIKYVSEVVAGGGCKMRITQSDQEGLRVEARKETLDRVSVDQSGSKLSLRVKSKDHGFNIFNWFNGDHDEVVYILQLKNLNRLELNGACNANLSDWVGKSLDVHASGASEIKFANLKIEDLFVELSGASNSYLYSLTANKAKFEMSGAANTEVKSAGTTKFLKVGASGASNFHGKSLVANQAELDASGASNIDLSVTEYLDAGASGASNIHYLGQPKVKSNASGASHIEMIN